MYRKIKLLLVVAATALIPGLSLAQQPVETVDLARIPQKAVRNLVRKENVKTAADFQNIATSCYRIEDSLLYQTNLKEYEVRSSIGEVWKKYLNMTPREAWTGKTVNFGFLFSKPGNKFIYIENADDPIEEGNIIYVNLRFLRGLKNLGVAFEITRIDEANKIIAFCYLEDGVSTGSQEIRFIEMPDGLTRISHLTHYRSRSAFRDKELYPRFHEKFVGEFHENIMSQIEKGL